MSNAIEDDNGPADSVMAPLAGEAGIPSIAQVTRAPMSGKGLFAVAFLVLSLLAVSAFSVQRFAAGKKPGETGATRAGDRPAAASLGPRRLDMSVAMASAPASTPNAYRVPAIVSNDDEAAEPIGVRRTGQGLPATPSSPGSSTRPKVVLPEDAPALLVTSRPSTTSVATSSTTRSDGDSSPTPDSTLAETRRNLEAYERQLQALLVAMTRQPASESARALPGAPLLGTPAGAPSSAGTPPGGNNAPTAALLGGQLPRSSTPPVAAALLGNRSLILPKGTAFTCALQTRVVSSAAGLIGCQVQRNVFGADGRVLLIERGSHLDGEYRVAALKPGSVSIPVLWTRIRTPNGVTVDIDSPGTGKLGESGIDGDVDNRWGERIGAAFLLSLIDDAVQLAIQHENSAGQGGAVVLPSTTANTSKLADKVLDSTINIPPLIYRNQGGIVGIVVARDVDFSTVYELQPSTP